MVRLSVLETEKLEATQIDLTGEGDAAAGFDRLVNRLSARLGASRIARFLPVNTHIPEREVIDQPLATDTSVTSPLRGGRNLQAAGAANFGRGGSPDTSSPPPETGFAPLAGFDLPSGGRLRAASSTPKGETPPDRPLRLFARPEPVQVVAEIPEGPPRLFRWRRVLHEVARAEGPERIAPEWWQAEDQERDTRDYFRVEDAEGRRYWIFREGLYERETSSPVWYLHGLFP
jgi:protein ImuB